MKSHLFLLSFFLFANVFAQEINIDFKQETYRSYRQLSTPVVTNDTVYLFTEFGYIQFPASIKNDLKEGEFSTLLNFQINDTLFQDVKSTFPLEIIPQAFVTSNGSLLFQNFEIRGDNIQRTFFDFSSDSKFIELSDGTVWNYSSSAINVLAGPEDSLIYVDEISPLSGIAEDSEGNIWMAENNGIWRLGQDTVHYDAASIGGSSQLDNIQDLFIDSQDRIWVANAEVPENSFSAGFISYFDGNVWTSFSETEDQTGLPDAYPSQIYERPNGDIVVLSKLGNFSVFDGNIWDHQENLSGTRWVGIVYDSDGTEILVSANERGLSVSFFQENLYSHNNAALGFSYENTNATNEHTDVIFTIDSTFLFFNSAKSWTAFDLSDTTFSNTNSPIQISEDIEEVVFSPSDSNIYFLSAINKKPYRLRPPTYSVASLINEAAFYSAWSIATDAEGNVWIARGHPRFEPDTEGLRKIDSESQSIDYDTTDGLFSNVVYDISLGKDGKLYAAHENGYSIFDGSKWSSMSISDNVGKIKEIEVDSAGKIYLSAQQNFIWYSDDGENFSQLDFTKGATTNLYDEIIIDDDGFLWAMALGRAQILIEDQLYTLPFDFEVYDLAFGLDRMAFGTDQGVKLGQIRNFLPMNPKWDGPNTLLSEITPVGTSLGYVSAFDKEDGTIPVAIDNDKFEIRDDSVYLVAPLDFETNEKEIVTLTAIDSDGGSSTLIEELFLFDVQESPTLNLKDSLFSFNYQTSDPVIGIVGTAQDDEGDEFLFEIVGGNQDSIFFIDEHTGELSIVNYTPISRERDEVFTLTIRVKEVLRNFAYDEGEIVVFLEDNLPPVFNSTVFSVEENRPKEEPVASLDVTDVDSDGFVFFLPVPVTEFSVDSLTGVISQSVENLDYEDSALYVFTIGSTDFIDTSFAEIQIEVLDVNDPVIADSSLEFSISNREASGTILGNVNAFDQDGDPITYRIESHEQGFFDVDEEGNIVYLKNNSTPGEYEFQVISADGVTEFSTTVSILIELVLGTTWIPTVTIYPIPADDFIEVSHTINQPLFFRIYSFDGRLVHSGTQNRIDISDFKKGIYYLVIQDQKLSISINEKILIK